jgi:hypothetical protein
MPDQNRFLHGPFTPVEEELTVFDLPVTGRVPAGLSGRYLRNGPNPLGLEDPGYRFWEGHWFLGPGMVHGVRLRDGKAEWYRNRWVRSRQLAEAWARNGRPGRCTPTWTSPPTPTSSPTPAATWPPWRPARCRMSCPASWTPSGRATSAGRCPAGSPRTPSSTGDRGAARHRLLLGLGPRPARRHRRRRPGQPHHRHPGTRRADDARLRAHRKLRGAARPAGHLQPGRGIGRAEAALHLEPGRTRPGSACCPGGTPRPASAGSRWTRAGSSTPSTPTTTAAGSWSTWSGTQAPTTSPRYDRERAADPGPVDHRPGRRDSHPAAP